jgi:hypothetical protein
MSALRWIAAFLFFAVWVSALALGVWYAFLADGFMSYHLAVAGMEPAEIPEGIARLYDGMLSSFGGALIAICVLSGALAVSSLQKGEAAGFAIAAAALGGLAAFMAASAWTAGAETGAVAPVAPLASVAVICLLALAFWLGGGSRRSRFSGGR